MHLGRWECHSRRFERRIAGADGSDKLEPSCVGGSAGNHYKRARGEIYSMKKFGCGVECVLGCFGGI